MLCDRRTRLALNPRHCEQSEAIQSANFAFFLSATGLPTSRLSLVIASRAKQSSLNSHDKTTRVPLADSSGSPRGVPPLAMTRQSGDKASTCLTRHCGRSNRVFRLPHASLRAERSNPERTTPLEILHQTLDWHAAWRSRRKRAVLLYDTQQIASLCSQ